MITGCRVSDIKEFDCKVLVACSAYNHESVLADALEGFVKQRTSFPFVVLVHDDASTDGTAAVIKDYESRYPEIIKGVYEDKNQYQQGNYFWYLEYLRNSKASYFALCEGDDFWISPDKLELQYQHLSNNDSLAYCFTNAVKIDAVSGDEYGAMLPFFPSESQALEKKILNTEDLLGLAFIPTASLFSRKDAWLKQPRLPKEAFQGDRAHQIYLSLSGDAIYIDRVTCAYRVNNEKSEMGSWAASRERMAEVFKSYIVMYECFDKDTGGRYRAAVQDAIDTKKFELMFFIGDKSALGLDKSLAIARKRGWSGVMKCLLFMLSPKLYLKVRSCSRNLQGKVSVNA